MTIDEPMLLGLFFIGIALVVGFHYRYENYQRKWRQSEQERYDRLNNTGDSDEKAKASNENN